MNVVVSAWRRARLYLYVLGWLSILFNASSCHRHPGFYAACLPARMSLSFFLSLSPASNFRTANQYHPPISTHALASDEEVSCGCPRVLSHLSST